MHPYWQSLAGGPLIGLAGWLFLASLGWVAGLVDPTRFGVRDPTLPSVLSGSLCAPSFVALLAAGIWAAVRLTS
ncbi:MAG: hypothetical protein ACREWJ_00640 [Rhodoferax sp.]